MRIRITAYGGLWMEDQLREMIPLTLLFEFDHACIWREALETDPQRWSTPTVR